MADNTLAPVNSNGVETNPPKATFANDNVGAIGGSPSTPSTSIGELGNTFINNTNYTLAHMCDFSQDIKKNINLKKFLKAIAEQIRKAIRYIMKLLGLTDMSGTLSQLLNWLKNKARELNDFIKRIVKPIKEFIAFVREYILFAVQMLAYILSLPARFLAMLADCLKKIVSAVADVWKDVWAESGGPGFDTTDLEDLKKSAEEIKTNVEQTIQTAQDKYKDVVNTVETASNAIANEIAQTSGELTPEQAASTFTIPLDSADAESATSANATLTSELPTQEDSADSTSSASTPADKKNTP